MLIMKLWVLRGLCRPIFNVAVRFSPVQQPFIENADANAFDFLRTGPECELNTAFAFSTFGSRSEGIRTHSDAFPQTKNKTQHQTYQNTAAQQRRMPWKPETLRSDSCKSNSEKRHESQGKAHISQHCPGAPSVNIGGEILMQEHDPAWSSYRCLRTW